MRTEGVWIVPAVEVDEVGDPELDGDGNPVLSGEPWYWSRCNVWPRQSTETAESGVRIISGLNVWMRGSAVPTVDVTDTVLVRSRQYQVDGIPGIHPGKGVRLVLSALGSTHVPVGGP